MACIDSRSVSIAMIEFRQLKYFAKVAELQHFGRASEELHVVQPALSRQVKQLEEELGVELFERLPRGVRLTQAGVLLLERTNHLLADVERMVAATKLAAQGRKGFLRVGFADGTIYSGHLPQVIKHFRKQYPDIELELIPASSVAQSELLANGSINIGFVYWLPSNIDQIEHHDIHSERIVLAVPKSSSLASKKSLRLRDLKDCPFVWIKRSNSPMYYDLILSQCTKAGLTLNVVQEGTTESIMLSLVAAEIGVTFITESAQRRKPDNVVLVDIKDLDATITLKAMWRSDEYTPAIREFLSVVRKSSSQHQ
jgi:DNA-binding transcriptional LysR family regulator